MRNIIEFIEYEEKCGRACKMECENQSLLEQIQESKEADIIV